MGSKPVINIDELEYADLGDGGKFAARLARISPAIGAKKLGYNITKVPPGKRAFPLHFHHGIEEMFFILDGEGTMRFGEQERPLKKGDFIAFPAGPHGGHQIINTGTSELTYLAVSTTTSPDIVEYPDSGKIGAMAGDFSNREMRMDVRLYVSKDSGVGYFEGESD